jgi:hypothetical protein
MIKKLLAAAVLSAVCAPAFAQQACTDATAITAPTTLSGDTGTASGGMTNVGPYSLAGNQKVWTFAAGANVNGTFTVTATWGWALFVTTACSASAPAPKQSMATGDPSTTLTLDPTRYTAGTTYYVILSGLAAAVNTGLDPTGAYNINVTPTLPVTLQEFSID